MYIIGYQIDFNALRPVLFESGEQNDNLEIQKLIPISRAILLDSNYVAYVMEPKNGEICRIPVAQFYNFRDRRGFDGYKLSSEDYANLLGCLHGAHWLNVPLDLEGENASVAMLLNAKEIALSQVKLDPVSVVTAMSLGAGVSAALVAGRVVSNMSTPASDQMFRTFLDQEVTFLSREQWMDEMLRWGRALCRYTFR